MAELHFLSVFSQNVRSHKKYSHREMFVSQHIRVQTIVYYSNEMDLPNVQD